MATQTPTIDPLSPTSTTIIPPREFKEGFWAGACSALYDPASAKWYLYYRIREPRPVRGGNCYVAESDDGISFKTIWQATKEQLDSQSIEKGCVIRSAAGVWHLYISYVDPADARWRIDMVVARHPREFDLSKRQTVLTAREAGAGVEGVKDPCVLIHDGTYYLYYTYAHPPSSSSAVDAKSMHATGDVYNTGITLASTGLLTSKDGIKWERREPALQAASDAKAWDHYCARICSVLRLGDRFLAYYDGSNNVSENYEEKCGLAAGSSLLHFDRQTVSGPAHTSPHGTHSLRYVSAVDKGDGLLYFFYEYCRADGSHELRRTTVAKT